MSIFNKFVFNSQLIFLALREQPKPLVQPVMDLLPFGLPQTENKKLTYIYRHGYISAFDEEYLVPKWVCWRIDAKNINELNTPRIDLFERDVSLKLSPMPSQYVNTGFDMGHMCDCEDMSYSPLTQKETFILSNIVPQAPHFNRGIWGKLERETRKLVKQTNDDYWILASCSYDNTCPKLDNIVIPYRFEKQIINIRTKEKMLYSFPHTSPWGYQDDLKKYLTNTPDLKIV
jgi:DNA/RNA endonuclease G (NUC1)